MQYTSNDLFKVALGITDPLFVDRVEFDEIEQELHIYIDFKKGSKFRCPICDEQGKAVHDTKDKVWRHLNFFQYKSFIHFRTPRIECDIDGIHLITPPWAGKGDFTLLMDAYIISLVKCIPVSKVAAMLDEHDTKIWRIVRSYIYTAHAISEFNNLDKVGVDETSYKKGHNYITSFVDMNQKKVIYVAEGKSSETLVEFKEELPCHSASLVNIREFSIDMSPAFIKGISDNFPRAVITFDKFHVVALMNDAVDKTRRIEQKEYNELKNTRYLWLKNPVKLTEKQTSVIEDLKNKNLKTGRAYRIKLELQDIYRTAIDSFDAEERLKKLYNWAVRSRIQPVKDFAKTLKKHMSGILHYFDSRLTNGILEGINGIIKGVIARARGFKNINNLKVMIYLVAGKLPINFTPNKTII